MPALDARLLCFELLQLPVEDTTGIDDDDDGCNNDDPDPTADADNDDGVAVRDDGGGGGGIARDWRPPKPLAPPFSSFRSSLIAVAATAPAVFEPVPAVFPSALPAAAASHAVDDPTELGAASFLQAVTA